MNSYEVPTLSPTANGPEARSGWHRLHVTHLVFGLLFTGFAAAWLAAQQGIVDSGDIRWLLPLPWVIAGLVGLIAAAASNRRPEIVSPETVGTETVGTETVSPETGTALGTAADTKTDA